MQKIFILSHASDIDGVGSAALLKRKYSLSSNRLFFASYSKESIDYVDKKLSKFYKSGITLFLTDLGVNDSIVNNYLKILEKVKKYEGKIYWFDHHPWTKLSIKKLASICEVAVIGENKDYCATEITLRKLGFKDAFTKNFARIVHLSDFNITPKSKEDYKLIGQYAMSITSYGTNESWDYVNKKLRHIADVISSGKLIDKTISAEAAKFDRVNKLRAQKMAKDLIIRKNFAIGFSKHVQSTYGCAAVMNASKKRIGIYINTDNGKGHVRSTGQDISILARSLGGGGHPRASGFPIDLTKFNFFSKKEDKERFADVIEHKLAKK